MLLPCKRTAFTLQKQCFLNWTEQHTKRDYRPSDTKKSSSIGYRKRLYLEIENIRCSIYLHYVQDMNILAYLKGTCALRFRLLFL